MKPEEAVEEGKEKETPLAPELAKTLNMDLDKIDDFNEDAEEEEDETNGCKKETDQVDLSAHPFTWVFEPRELPKPEDTCFYSYYFNLEIEANNVGKPFAKAQLEGDGINLPAHEQKTEEEEKEKEEKEEEEEEYYMQP